MNLALQDFYDRVTFLYPLVDLFLKPQKKMLFQKVNACPPGDVLEIGVGNGSHLSYYTRHNVIGIDTSTGMLARARKFENPNIQLLEMNGEELEFRDHTFDYVILSHVIAVVERPDKVMNEVHRVLKPGGRLFVLNHFTPENGLRYVDILFGRFSRLLHFKSIFKVSNITGIEKFKLLSDANAGLFSYFKILVYEKGV